MKKEIKAPEIAESIFDIVYLAFDFVAAIIFFIHETGSGLFVLYGLLSLILGVGDAFHLVPRVLKTLKGENEKIHRWLGKGLQISSITMTIFYILLMYIWQRTFELNIPIVIHIVVWVSAIARIVICLMPANDWAGQGNAELSKLRNGFFLVTGLCIVILYAVSAFIYGGLSIGMVIAIVISFACYIPVTFLSKKKPMIGMLMIPKTLMYVWMLTMGFSLL